MLVFLPEILTPREIQIGLLGLVIGFLIFVFGRLIFSLMNSLWQRLNFIPISDINQKLIKPNQSLIIFVAVMAVVDILVSLLPNNRWTNSLEVITSLTLAIASSWLASQLFKNFFDFYLLNAAFKSGQKISSLFIKCGF